MGFPFFGKKSKKDSTSPPVSYPGGSNRGRSRNSSSTPSIDSSTTHEQPRFTLDPKADNLLPRITPSFEHRNDSPPNLSGAKQNGSLSGQGGGRARAHTTVGGGSLLDDFMFDFEKRIAEKAVVEEPEPLTPVSPEPAGPTLVSDVAGSKVFRLPGSGNGTAQQSYRSNSSTPREDDKINQNELAEALAMIRKIKEEPKPRSSSFVAARVAEVRPVERDPYEQRTGRKIVNGSSTSVPSTNGSGSTYGAAAQSPVQSAAPIPKFNRKARQQAEAGITPDAAAPSRNLVPGRNGQGSQRWSSGTDSDSDSVRLGYAQQNQQHQQPRSSRLATAPHVSNADLKRSASESTFSHHQNNVARSIKDSHLPSPPPSPALYEHTNGTPNGHVNGYSSDGGRLSRPKGPAQRPDYPASYRSESPAPFLRPDSPANYHRPESRNSHLMPDPRRLSHKSSHLSHRDPSPRPSTAASTDASDSDDEQSLAVIQSRHMEQQRSRSRGRRPGRDHSISSRNTSRHRSASRHTPGHSPDSQPHDEAPPPPQDMVLPAGARLSMTPQQQQMAAVAQQQMWAQMYYQQAAMQQRAILAMQQGAQGGPMPSPVPGPMTHLPTAFPPSHQVPPPAPPSATGGYSQPFPSPVQQPQSPYVMPFPPMVPAAPNGMGAGMPMPNGMPVPMGVYGMMGPAPVGMVAGGAGADVAGKGRKLSRKKSTVSVGSRRSGWAGEE
ncbi:hypothetical protein HK097_003790 [Rhizophlyctis rosea]|uniref:Uncharacterized protein n=1 Tax=Rhizophlyctis rosea TaxID=64517 RepID=A0AAD5SGE7_9FUNG|nr:hypothetical protein HK097_003790 [Rhizophlyctis rosea]